MHLHPAGTTAGSSQPTFLDAILLDFAAAVAVAAAVPPVAAVALSGAVAAVIDPVA